MKNLIFMLLFVTILFGNKFDNIKMVFINGIQNTQMEARASANELSVASVGYIGKVKPIYNISRFFLLDVLETYKYANFDGTNGNLRVR